MKILFFLLLMFFSSLQSIAHAMDYNLDALDKTKLIRYKVYWEDYIANVPIGKEANQIVKKQLEAFGFTNMIDANTITPENYPECFLAIEVSEKAFKNFKQYQLKPFSKKYDGFEQIGVLSCIWTEAYPNSNATYLVNKLGLHYDSNTGLSKSSRQSIKNHQTDMLLIRDQINQELTRFTNIANYFKNAYEAEILLGHKTKSSIKSEKDIYNDVHDQIKQGYTTYEQSSIYKHTEGFHLQIKFTDPNSTSFSSKIMPIASYHIVVEEDSLWMPLCKKWFEATKPKIEPGVPKLPKDKYKI